MFTLEKASCSTFCNRILTGSKIRPESWIDVQLLTAMKQMHMHHGIITDDNFQNVYIAGALKICKSNGLPIHANMRGYADKLSD
jgi:hypothetical protein